MEHWRPVGKQEESSSCELERQVKHKGLTIHFRKAHILQIIWHINLQSTCTEHAWKPNVHRTGPFNKAAIMNTQHFKVGGRKINPLHCCGRNSLSNVENFNWHLFYVHSVKAMLFIKWLLRTETVSSETTHIQNHFRKTQTLKFR